MPKTTEKWRANKTLKTSNLHDTEFADDEDNVNNTIKNEIDHDDIQEEHTDFDDHYDMFGLHAQAEASALNEMMETIRNDEEL